MARRRCLPARERAVPGNRIAAPGLGRPACRPWLGCVCGTVKAAEQTEMALWCGRRFGTSLSLLNIQWVIPARASSRRQLPLGRFQQGHTAFEPFRTESQPCAKVVVTVVWPAGPREVPTQLCRKISFDYFMCWFYFSYHLLITSKR